MKLIVYFSFFFTCDNKLFNVQYEADFVIAKKGEKGEIYKHVECWL